MGLLDWFKNKSAADTSSPPPKSLEERLEALEEQAARETAGYQGMPLNRAGDLCKEAGDRGRALSYYGRAIDALLAEGQREAARGVANKIIRIHPDAIRTLCTLTWLDLAAQHQATALLHLRDYVSAAREADQQLLARDQILAMARTVADEEFLAAAADALDSVDAADEAKWARDWAADGGSPEAIEDPEELAQECFRGALRSNERRGGAEPESDEGVEA